MFLVRIVSLKNKHLFLHPAESLEYTENGLEIPRHVPRISKEKRPNDIFWFTSEVFEDAFDSESGEFELGEGHGDAERNDNEVTESESNLDIETGNRNESQQVPAESNPDVDTSAEPINLNDARSNVMIHSPSTGFYGRSLANIKKFVQSTRHGNLRLPDPSPIVVSGRVLCLEAEGLGIGERKL